MRENHTFRKLKNKWMMLSIREKIGTFTGVVFAIIFLSIIFDLLVVRVSLTDFNDILEENARSSAFVDAMEEESAIFESYMKSPGDVSIEQVKTACEASKRAINNLPKSYHEIGPYRSAETRIIMNSYQVYEQKRDQMLVCDETSLDYIANLYEVYEMQDYIQGYARNLMNYTMEDGSQDYRQKIPGIKMLMVAAILVGITLLMGIFELSRLMRTTIISPVLKLSSMSKRIATNDFFIDDLQVENQDELGELVKAFNKMKFATGEYITALEDNRKTLDLLHEEELEKLEVENRLEIMRLEVLKNQINPHFLFNTLNVIGGMANLEDADTTEKMIKALSSLFRYNLKTTDAEVPLSMELKVVKDYMYIQQMRFGSRVQYDVDCQVDMDATIVPAFTFQPLVENAILHGLCKKEQGGRIHIHIWKWNHMLNITVADTGIGMEPEALEHLIQLMKEEDRVRDQKTGIGLGNIYKRIYGMYKNSSVDLYSRSGVGTIIKIQIPQQQEDDTCIEY